MQSCAVCKTSVSDNPRYPRYVCQPCAQKVKSQDGRVLLFANSDPAGGFAATYADGSPYLSHECFIDGVRCHADEARFGGIVIQVIPAGDATAEVDNPWKQLPDRPPFVLCEDAPLIDAYNVTAKDDFLLHTEILPEPFIGRTDAPIVVLGLNPGFKEIDREYHSQPKFVRRLRDNLCEQPSDWPFYLLAPDIKRTAWCELRLGPLIKEVGAPAVAVNVLCVEFFPYHSKHFRHHRLRLASQAYGFQLVRRAIARNAVIILLRSGRLWIRAVPELEYHTNLYAVNSVQNPVVSERNCPDGFAAAMAILRGSRPD